MFYWEKDEVINVGRKKVHINKITGSTFTLALNDDNAVENSLKMARATDQYDRKSFTYCKLSVWFTLLKLITKFAIRPQASRIRTAYAEVFGNDIWSEWVRYVPASDPSWKKKGQK
jgi:hypothetical protein